MSILFVTNTNNSGLGSLRDTLALAASGDTIRFQLGSNSVINLNSELLVNKHITIDASEVTGLTLNGNSVTRLIRMDKAISLTLKNLILANGRATQGSGDERGGGAIRGSNDSILIVQNSEFRNNIAGVGGAIYTGFRSSNTFSNTIFKNNDGSLDYSEHGGGAIATKSAGNLTVIDSIFTGNKGSNGGAINSLLGNLTVEGSTFRNNDSTTGGSNGRTQGFGGAIYTDGANASGTGYGPGPIGGKIRINNSRFEGNLAAGQGGALFLFAYNPDRISFENSTLINNRVKKNGSGQALGGGLRVGIGRTATGTNFTLSNTTFVNNLAEGQGGGLWIGQSTDSRISNVQFLGNRADGPDGSTPSGRNGYGGAVVLETTSPIVIDNSTFLNNVAAGQAGALWRGIDNTTITDSVFVGNTAENGGSGWNISQQIGAKQLSSSSPIFSGYSGSGNFEWGNPITTSNQNTRVTEDGTIIANPKLTSFTDTGTAQQAFVRPANSAMLGAGAGASSFSRFPDTLSSPKSFTAINVSSNQIRLDWQDASSNETGFRIERSPNGINGWTLVEVTAANVTSLTKYVSSTPPYTYRLAAINAEGESRFRYATNGIIAPEIEVSMGVYNLQDGSKQAINFGSTLVSSPLTKTFSVRNGGNSNLTLSNLQLPTGFSQISALPTNIAPGATAQFQVRLNATQVGSLSGRIAFSTNDPNESLFDFPITGIVSGSVNSSLAATARPVMSVGLGADQLTAGRLEKGGNDELSGLSGQMKFTEQDVPRQPASIDISDLYAQAIIRQGYQTRILNTYMAQCVETLLGCYQGFLPSIQREMMQLGSPSGGYLQII